MKIEKKGIAIVLIIIIGWLTVNNPWTNSYVTTLKTIDVPVDGKNELIQRIEKEAKAFYIAPKDAVVDSVWKATAGYNGLKVDIEGSYKKMKKEGKYQKDLLIFEQISPKVHLSDLPAAPIYRGNPDKPMVSFLINVAWGNEHLPKILSALKKHQVFATFFLEGRWVKENPDLAKMIVDAGHEVGNHSYSHPNMKNLSSAEIQRELTKTNEIIESTIGKRVKWFAPPSGSFGEEVVDIAASMHMKTILWSVDTIDWQKPSVNVMIERVVKKVHPGAMILMHPTQPTADAMEQLIIEIKKKNLRIGTVTQLLKEDRIILPQGNNPTNSGET
ncbi:polysaccharide deacetylase family protein [Bacillus spongiae]|uniref:Polysaccharide deacetylase family protein n=1 Tax=Bacillus spongiae TaxID=2683610 RepID=A0ABU8HAH7_9BACI